MRRFFLVVLPIFLYGAGDFITQKEYASQLFKNPRGIGCQHCHGERGEGRLIANYKHRDKPMSFSGPAIDRLSYKKFYQALNRRINAMPRYFLTDEEIQALYFHIRKKEEQKKGTDAK